MCRWGGVIIVPSPEWPSIDYDEDDVAGWTLEVPDVPVCASLPVPAEEPKP